MIGWDDILSFIVDGLFGGPIPKTKKGWLTYALVIVLLVGTVAVLAALNAVGWL